MIILYDLAVMNFTTFNNCCNSLYLSLELRLSALLSFHELTTFYALDIPMSRSCSEREPRDGVRRGWSCLH